MQLKNSTDDNLNNFDFGLPYGVWPGQNTYMGQVAEGLGVCIYRLSASPIDGWLMQFFPFESKKGLTENIESQFANWVVSRAKGVSKPELYGYKGQYSFSGPHDNACVILAIVEEQRKLHCLNHRTIK